MALTTYSELQTAVASLLDRGDLADKIPDFIALAEADFNRELRVRQMLQRSQAQFTQPYTALPGDYLEIRDLLVISPTPSRSLAYLPMQALDDLKRRNTGTPSQFFTLVGDSIEVWPPPAGDGMTVELTYYKRIPALSAVAPSNWLLTSYPGLYLYASALHSAPFLNDDERLPTWGQLAAGIRDTMRLESERALAGPRPTIRNMRTSRWPG